MLFFHINIITHIKKECVGDALLINKGMSRDKLGNK